MRHTLISGLLGLMLLAPVASSAATVGDIQLQLMQVLGRVAAQKAQISGDALACALVTTKTSVAMNEPFALIWNTVGANELSSGDTVSQWAPAGITSLAPDKPGLYKYELEFHGSGGAKTTCRTLVSVRAVR